MMTADTYAIRQQLIRIARRDVGQTEVTKNRAPFIEKLWTATDYTDGMDNREPYCAAGMAYCLREWLKLPAALDALKMTRAQANAWRCRSARAFGWLEWAEEKGVTILKPNSILHAADIVVYSFSHIELVTDDDNTSTGPFTAIGYNTDSGNAASNEGQGTYEKQRTRAKVKKFIRLLA